MGIWTTTPRTWVAGEVPTAANFNTDVRDFGRAFADAWTSYTPTLTGFTLGNGTAQGYYMRAGKLIAFRALITFGSSSAAASAYPQISLPVTAASAIAGAQTLSGTFYDASATVRYLAGAYVHTTTTALLAIVGTSGAWSAPTTTTPFGATWTTSDTLAVSGVYEAA